MELSLACESWHEYSISISIDRTFARGGCMFSRNMFIRICSYLLWPLYLYIWPLYFAYPLRCRLAVVRQGFFSPGLYIDLCNSLDSNSRKVTPCNSLDGNSRRLTTCNSLDSQLIFIPCKSSHSPYDLNCKCKQTNKLTNS